MFQQIDDQLEKRGDSIAPLISEQKIMATSNLNLDKSSHSIAVQYVTATIMRLIRTKFLTIT